MITPERIAEIERIMNSHQASEIFRAINDLLEERKEILRRLEAFDKFLKTIDGS